MDLKILDKFANPLEYVWPEKNRQIHWNKCDQKKLPKVYKRCPNMISLEKLKILTLLQQLLKNVWKLLPKALKGCPKSNKSPNLVTLIGTSDKGYFEMQLMPVPKIGKTFWCVWKCSYKASIHAFLLSPSILVLSRLLKMLVSSSIKVS